LKDEMYYQSEGGMVPIRWTPPESYKYKKYSSASDVWSFGITLYEIFTNAALPYGKSWSNLNVMVEVECGYRLPPPPGCPRAIYKVMMQSWNPHRRARPTFAQLVDSMELAYDMLFPADSEQIATKASTEDCHDLETVYMGVPVPDLNHLDENAQFYLAPGMDIRAEGPVKLPAVPERVSTKRPTQNKSDDDTKRMSAYQYSDDGLTAVLKKETTNASDDNHTSNLDILRPSVMRRQGSLRKQKETEIEDDTGRGVVDYVSNKAVEEVLRIAREREKLSRAEVTGLTRAGDLGESIRARPTYIEQVGRATDVKATAAIKGRGVCKCRRFKCVCKPEDLAA